MPGAARWRRRDIPTSLPADIPALAAAIVASGGAVLSTLFDRRIGQGIRTPGFLDSWAPAVGGSPLLCLADASRPAVDASGILTFDGVDDVLRAAGDFGITGSCFIVLIAKGQTSITGRAWELSQGAGVSILTGQQGAGPIWATKGIAPVAMVANAAQPQILSSRKTTTVDIASRVGTAAEVAAADATGNQTPNRFTLGNNRIDVPSSAAPLTGVCAVVMGVGVYSAAINTLVANWAIANHGAA
jgi:hypothetical protein